MYLGGGQRTLPGHFLEFSDGIVRTTRWVQPAFLPGDAPVSPAEIEEVLRGSAAAHKVADVEVAGFLSGGVDSAYLTALARPARTYTISYAEPKYDESFPARALARSLGVRNRVRRISPGEFWDAVPAVQYHMDEPLADAAAVALYFLNREASKDVKVVLSGEGADELFGGYNIYRDPFTARWYDRLPPWLRAGLGAAAALLLVGVCAGRRHMGGAAVRAGNLAADVPVLVVDAGHGGFDGGAVSASGVSEQDINLTVARRVCALAAFFGKRGRAPRDDGFEFGHGDPS